MYDLRYDPDSVMSGAGRALCKSDDASQDANPDLSADCAVKESSKYKTVFPVVKELCYNKCPAVAPINVLDGGGWEKIGLAKSQVEENLKKLLIHPEFAERMRSEYEKRPEFPPATEPEGMLYDGFLNEADKRLAAEVRSAMPERLADYQPEFQDERLPELLLHYKGRNFPETLSEAERGRYEKYRTERLQRQLPKFMEELARVEDDFLKEELMLYAQSLQ